MNTLIVGQGLAGSLLAWELLRRGRQVIMVDDDHACSSSMAAAGLINPVTGMRLVKHPMTGEFLAAASESYRSLERELRVPLLHWIPMWRATRSEKDRDRYRARYRHATYRDYIGPWSTEPPHPNVAPHAGGFMQRHTGFLQPQRLLAALKARFQRLGLLRIARIEPKAMSIQHGGIALAGCSASEVVFCEGFRGAANPWFDWLPFQPVKGEILTLRTETELPEAIINAGHWLLPLGNGRFKLGATYDRKRLDCQPTRDGREQLLAAIPHLLQGDTQLVIEDQRAGVRPSTLDKAPFLGRHPHHPELIIFNGFGSRGSLTIPWYARWFADYLCGRADLPRNGDIQRYRDRLS